jgi:hypothetical protein
MMAFRVPWNRDTRLGLFGDDFALRKELAADFKDGTGEKPYQFVRIVG